MLLCDSQQGLLEVLQPLFLWSRGGGRRREEEEQRRRSSRTMDVSLLRHRSSRETRRRQTQLLLFRTVSEQLLEAVSVVPVAQGLTSLPPAMTFDPDPSNYDPWHVHLDLHRRSCPRVAVQLPASSPETTNSSVTGSCRRPSSSSSGSVRVQESRGRKLSVDSTSESLSSSGEVSPCSSFNSTKEEDLFDVERSRADPDSGSSERSRGGPPDDSQESSAPGSLTSSDESSTPVASTTCSPSSSATNLQEDLRGNQSAAVQTSNGILQTSSSPAWRGSRQLSVGGVGSSWGVHQNQNYYPFPNRKTPRISEAARRLGM